MVTRKDRAVGNNTRAPLVSALTAGAANKPSSTIPLEQHTSDAGLVAALIIPVLLINSHDKDNHQGTVEARLHHDHVRILVHQNRHHGELPAHSRDRSARSHLRDGERLLEEVALRSPKHREKN
jgi:hypothetical protein